MNLFIAVLVLIMPVAAQDTTVYILPQVEVKALRGISGNFQSAVELNLEGAGELRRGLTLEEPLAGVPGLIAADRNNPSLGDKIIIRGIGSRASFGIRGIRIMADNIPLTLPDGQSQTNNIDLYSAGRMEVIKGPASFIFGNASGGVISIYSEIPKNPFNAEAAVLGGSFNLQKYSLKVSGREGNLSYLLSGGRVLNKSFREHSSESYYIANSVIRNNFSPELSASFVINYYNAPYLMNPGSLNKKDSEERPEFSRQFVRSQGAGEKLNQLQGGITLKYSGERLRLESSIYMAGRELLNPIPGRIIKLNRKAGGIRTSGEYSTRLLKLKGGIDLEVQRDSRQEFTNNGITGVDLPPEEIFPNLNYGSRLLSQREEVFVYAPFITAETSVNKYLGLFGGLRYDNYSFNVTPDSTQLKSALNMDQFSPAAGIYFLPAAGSKLFFNYTTSFQTPTTSELSNREESEGGFNPDLKPEVINSYEIGGVYTLPWLNLNISASVYFMKFQNLLIPYQVRSGLSEQVFFRNAGSAQNAGFEVELNASPAGGFNVALAYTNMNFKFNNYLVEHEGAVYQLKDNKLPGVPPAVFSSGISYSAENGYWGSIDVKWTDSYFANDFNGPPPGDNSELSDFINDAYVKVDFKTGYKFNYHLEAEVFIGINNLLDTRYNSSVVANAAGKRYFEPAAGRNYFGGLRLAL